MDAKEAHQRSGPVDNTGLKKKFGKGGITMDFCAGLLFCVIMIAIWLDEAGFWKWLRKKFK
jgi:hypothetical protein